jgi:tetratricopeptide (TPR) repeat protein
VLSAVQGGYANAAVGHLFRNLEDPVRLERNPIVRHLFADPKTGCVDSARTCAALRDLRQLILRAADLAKEADLALNQDRQALRQHAIVRKVYFDGIPLARVAGQLGISVRQLYRERTRICQRIAAFIWDHRFESLKPIADNGFGMREFELDRARAFAELGESGRAIAIYERLMLCANSLSGKADLACVSAQVALYGGNYQLAHEKLAIGNALSIAARSEELSDAPNALASGRVALTLAKLHRAEGRTERAQEALDRAAEAARRCPSEGIEGSRFFMDVALERATCLADHGHFQAALESLTATSTLVRERLAAVPGLRAELQTLCALFALVSPRGDPGERDGRHVDTLYDSLSLARAQGSFQRVINAMLVIAQHFACHGLGDKARDTVREVVSIAMTFPNVRVRAIALLNAADILLMTRDHPEALDLLSKAECDLPKNSLERVKLYGLKSQILFFNHDYANAWQAGATGELGAARLQNRRFLGGAWRNMALAEHALGKVNDAKQRIRASIRELERTGSPLSLARAYRAAAMITRDSRWRIRSNEVFRQLSS